MNETDGDFVTILSSELIAEVMEEYFNRRLFKQKVKVVDLQPQGQGYAFTLSFVKEIVVEGVAPMHVEMITETIPGMVICDTSVRKRGDNGRFIKAVGKGKVQYEDSLS